MKPATTTLLTLSALALLVICFNTDGNTKLQYKLRLVKVFTRVLAVVIVPLCNYTRCLLSCGGLWLELHYKRPEASVSGCHSFLLLAVCVV